MVATSILTAPQEMLQLGLPPLCNHQDRCLLLWHRVLSTQPQSAAPELREGKGNGCPGNLPPMTQAQKEDKRPGHAGKDPERKAKHLQGYSWPSLTVLVPQAMPSCTEASCLPEPFG